ncbi:MAG: hypothetical protein K2M63_11015 [Muribaculaceae bacterium]|nr:hypothetical protein [Muribaculaceae bacterium]
MNTKQFRFSGTIKGQRKALVVTAPVENGAVITNKFCPPALLTGGVDFATPIHGEVEPEFIMDCQTQIKAMEGVGNNLSLWDIHEAALTTAVMMHISRCGRLIFGDLLTYMDVFSLLLEADGFSDNEIRRKYPKVLKSIIAQYSKYILNTHDLSAFSGSHMDIILQSLCLKS